MAKQQQYVKGVTPAGVSMFPKLTTPDTKFKPEGEYVTKQVIEAEQAQPLIDKIEAEIAKAYEAAAVEMVEKGKAKTIELAKKKLKFADKCYRAEEDDDGNETGKFIFTLKSKASYADKKDLDADGNPRMKKLNPPALFDAKGKPMPKGTEVWGGSILKCSYEMMPFATAIGVGISLRLQAVQILELRTRGARDAAGYGFGEEEGFSAGGDDDGAAPAADDDTPAVDDSGAAGNPDF